MWETIKVIFIYIFSIGIVLVIGTFLFFAFMTLIVFMIELFREKSSIIKKLFKAITAIITFLIVAFVGLFIFVSVLDYAEDEDHEQRLDKRYEELANKEDLSLEHIFVNIAKPERIRNRNPKVVRYYIKNYNEATFDGRFILQAKLDGQVVSEEEHKIRLKSGEFYSDVTFASDLNRPETNISRAWRRIEIDYLFDGEFIE